MTRPAVLPAGPQLAAVPGLTPGFRNSYPDPTMVYFPPEGDLRYKLLTVQDHVNALGKQLFSLNNEWPRIVMFTDEQASYSVPRATPVT